MEECTSGFKQPVRVEVRGTAGLGMCFGDLGVRLSLGLRRRLYGVGFEAFPGISVELQINGAFFWGSLPFRTSGFRLWSGSKARRFDVLALASTLSSKFELLARYSRQLVTLPDDVPARDTPG